MISTHTKRLRLAYEFVSLPDQSGDDLLAEVHGDPLQGYDASASTVVCGRGRAGPGSWAVVTRSFFPFGRTKRSLTS